MPGMGGFPHLKKIPGQLFDVFFPPACPLCLTTLVPGHKGFCLSCSARITPLTGAHCPCCALPFTGSDNSSHLCGHCLRDHPPFQQVYAYGLYEGALRDAIHRFKFNQKVGLDRILGALLSTALGSEVTFDLVVPVPLHRRSLQQRCYNQSLLLAREVGTLRSWQVSSPVLEKVRETVPQHGLPAARRAENLRGAFQARGVLNGESILLVDDVMTTGSTVTACARTLLDAGAGSVSVAVLARAAR